MPGNDLGDRVHNFFAQDNLLQGQHHSQVQEGNWPVLNSNFWVGSQGQVDQLSANSKIYNSQNSDVDRGETVYAHLPHHLGNGLNLTQSNLRAEQPNLNGFFYANQFLHARQNEANFLGMDTGSDNHNLTASRGLLAPDVLQEAGGGVGYQTKASDRSEASVSPVSFDLFGGQQQMNQGQQQTNHGQQRMSHEQSNTTPHHQIIQQIRMMKKLQEIQLQQQHNRQLDLRQQYLGNQLTPFPKQSSGVQSTLVNGTTNSDTSLYPQTAVVGTSGLNQVSPSMHGSPNFPSNLGQTQGLVNLAPHVDKSLYGVPVSSSRGLNMDHYSQMVTSGASIPQLSISSNFLQGNQPNLFPEQVRVQGESPVSRHKVQNDDMFGYSSKQSQFLGLGNMGSLHQANSVSGNRPQKQSLQEKTPKQVALPQNEVGLDPTEEKILFGSNDNVWAAFGKESNATGEAGNIFDNDGSNGLPSIQGGSWSAFMQSAVAETSSNDTVLQEEWSGLASQKNNGTSCSRSPSFHDSFKPEKPLVEDSKRMPSALNSGSFPPSNNISNNAMTSKQHRQKFQNEPDQRLQTEASQIFFQSWGEADKSLNRGPLQNSVAAGIRYRDASQPSHWAERNAKTTEFPGTSRQANGWNALKAVPTKGEHVMNSDDAEKLLQNLKNSQVGWNQGKVSHGSSLWKSNSLPISSMELDNVKSRASNPQANQGSLKDTTSVDNSRNARKNETSSQFQSSYSFSKWTNVHPSSRSQGGESLGMLLNQANDPNQVLESMSGREKDEGARFELEIHDVKENSDDSHHSNLSQHSTRGFREGGVLDTTDSRRVTAGTQNLANQLSRKVSAPLKFQYHPMGNVDEDVDPAYDLKQPSHVQTIHQKNAHFDQKIFAQATQNSTLIGKGQSSELQRDIRGPYEKPPRGDLSGHVHNRPVLHNQHSETLSSASSSSQNMLELFNKVDHSRNHGAMVQLNSFVPSSQRAVVEKHDEFGHLQHSQSHVSQGFGLQLGPPSQQLQISDRPLSSQNDQGAFNLLWSNNTASKKGDKSPRMVAKNSVQSLPSEETQPEFKLNISRIPGHGGNENSQFKAPGNLSSFSSGIPYSRYDQNQQIAGLSGQMPLNQHIDSSRQNASYTQRTAEAISFDAYGGFQQDNHASLGAMSEQSGPSDVQEQAATATMEIRDSQRSSHHFPMPGLSQQGNSLHTLQTMGTNIPVHKQNTGPEIQQTSSQNLELPQPNIVESSDPLMQDHVNSQGFDGEEQRFTGSAGQRVACGSTEAVPEVKKSFGKAPFLKNHLDDSPSGSALMRKDIEAFGRSLKPNSFSHQNSTLLNQIQVSKDVEIDSGNRVSKRMKGQQLVHNDVLSDSLGSSRLAGLLQRSPSQDGNVVTRDDLGLSQDISRNDSCIDLMTSPRVDDHQVNPQMAPSWFSQYDAPRVTPSKPGEQSLPHGKCSSGSDTVNSENNRAAAPAPSDACQNSNNHQNVTISSVASRGVSSLKPLQLHATSQNMGILRPKKRKSAILDLYPWHKEISEVSRDHVPHSMTESDWDIASNCLIDKVDGVADLTEVGSLVLGYKQRLILTTRLIQKLLRSAPAAILSADATIRHDALVYAASRIALGDACSTVYHLRSLDVTCDNMDLHPPNGQLSVKNGVPIYAKAAEEFRGRIRKLKNDFSRLYKSASILDLRFECQDLDKVFSINRIAKFHGCALAPDYILKSLKPSQSDNAEPASASGSETSHKSTPLRYVTAQPLAENIPDEVQCLSL